MSDRLIDQRWVATRSIDDVEYPVFDELRFNGQDWIVVRGVWAHGRASAETYRNEAQAREAFRSATD
jgi:hypothetical protein